MVALLIGVMPVAVRYSSAGESGEIGIALFITCCAGLGIRQFTIIFQGFLVARKDFRGATLMVGIGAVIELIAVSASVHLLPSALGYLVGLATGACLSLGPWLAKVGRDTRGPAFVPGGRTGDTTALLHFAKWYSFGSVAGLLAMQINPVLLGVLAKPEVLAQYNVAARLAQALSAFFIKTCDVLLPHFSHMAAQTDGSLKRHFLLSSWIMATFGAILLVPTIPLAGQLLQLWLGPASSEASTYQLRVLVTSDLFGASMSAFGLFALGTDNVVRLARLKAEYSVIAVGASTLVVLYFRSAVRRSRTIAGEFYHLAHGRKNYPNAPRSRGNNRPYRSSCPWSLLDWHCLWLLLRLVRFRKNRKLVHGGSHLCH